MGSSGRPWKTPLLEALLTVFVCALWCGCSHLGERLEQSALDIGAPEAGEVLADLAANDAAMQSFRAAGAFTLTSPERPGIDRFRHSKILFRKPADLHVVGRGPLLTTVFRLTCVRDEFLIEFPTEKEYYYQIEGEQFDSVPFSVSPSDVAREMFLPEPWADLSPRQVQMTSYDPQTEIVTLDILDRGFARRWVRRRLTLTGFPWVVVRSERFDKRGNLLAVITNGDYQIKEGVRFPAKVDAEFPSEQTRMIFDMRAIKINENLDEAVFDIDTLKTRLVENLRHKPVQQLQD